MTDHPNIEIELIKLSSGDRLLRLVERASGLALEKKLDSQKPVLCQKEQLLRIFEAALLRAEPSPA